MKPLQPTEPIPVYLEIGGQETKAFLSSIIDRETVRITFIDGSEEVAGVEESFPPSNQVVDYLGFSIGAAHLGLIAFRNKNDHWQLTKPNTFAAPILNYWPASSRKSVFIQASRKFVEATQHPIRYTRVSEVHALIIAACACNGG